MKLKQLIGMKYTGKIKNNDEVEKGRYYGYKNRKTSLHFGSLQYRNQKG